MKIFTCLLFVFYVFAAYSQNCKSLYYLQNNRTIEMTIYNKNGNENGKQVFSISNVQVAGTNASSTVNTEMVDKKGKSITRLSNKIECIKGAVLMDMRMLISLQQIDLIKDAESAATVSYIEYPAVMEVGDRLKDGKFNMNIVSNGVTTSIDFKMTDRFVEAREKVTSAAGSWDAFKISYNSRVKMKIAGVGIPVTSEVSEWYAPDFGIVKTETKTGSALITAIH